MVYTYGKADPHWEFLFSHCCLVMSIVIHCILAYVKLVQKVLVANVFQS